MRLYALLLMLAGVCFGQAGGTFSLVGTAINTTNPDSPIAAPIQFRLANNACTLTISAPLIGSGPCLLKSYDEKSGRIEIISAGAANITWSGTVKGNLASGSYKVGAGAQTGSFYLAIVKQGDEAAESKPKPAPRPFATTPQGSCVPAIESAITGEVHGWDGETIFKLDNGQIWQQAEYDYTYFYEYHPDVTIYQTSGGCRMKVEDEDETIIVKRIK
jgi:hypothetical protein